MLNCASFLRNNISKNLVFQEASWRANPSKVDFDATWRWMVTSSSYDSMLFNRCFGSWKKKKNRQQRKVDQPHIKLVSRQSKLESSLFSELLAWTNKATVRDKRNNMNNITCISSNNYQQKKVHLTRNCQICSPVISRKWSTK